MAIFGLYQKKANYWVFLCTYICYTENGSCRYYFPQLIHVYSKTTTTHDGSGLIYNSLVQLGFSIEGTKTMRVYVTFAVPYQKKKKAI